MESDRFTSTVLRDDLRRLNSHLPRNRRSLDELLAEDSPSVPSVSGHVINMKKQELLDLSSSIPNLETSKIRLPIILLRRTDLGPGAFAVLGDPYEEYAVSVLSGSFSGTFEEYRRRGSSVVAVYKPQVSLLLRRFHSLVTIGFGTSSGNDYNPLTQG
jgi:uncharacterized protein (UPF0216 family)